jgi:hypothetical protein
MPEVSQFPLNEPHVKKLTVEIGKKAAESVPDMGNTTSLQGLCGIETKTGSGRAHGRSMCRRQSGLQSTTQPACRLSRSCHTAKQSSAGTDPCSSGLISGLFPSPSKGLCRRWIQLDLDDIRRELQTCRFDVDLRYHPCGDVCLRVRHSREFGPGRLDHFSAYRR